MGLVAGCRELGTPVTGGNVSFYNKTGEVSILPTPLIGMLGVIDDVAQRTPMGFSDAGDAIVLLGVTKEELSGSAWAAVVHNGHLGGMPPTPNFWAERALASLMIAASKAGLLSSAHDLSDGGIGQALVESCLRNNRGAMVRLPDGDPTVQLFSESPARAIVSLRASSLTEFERLCAQHQVPMARIGEVTDSARIEFTGQFGLDLDAVRDAWRAPIPAAMGA